MLNYSASLSFSWQRITVLLKLVLLLKREMIRCLLTSWLLLCHRPLPLSFFPSFCCAFSPDASDDRCPIGTPVRCPIGTPVICPSRSALFLCAAMSCIRTTPTIRNAWRRFFLRSRSSRAEVGSRPNWPRCPSMRFRWTRSGNLPEKSKTFHIEQNFFKTVQRSFILPPGSSHSAGRQPSR